MQRVASGGLPAYVLLLKCESLEGGTWYGDILIESMSRDTPVAERERVLRAICEGEGLENAFLYSNRAAYQAHYPDIYPEAPRRAFHKGILGKLVSGVFQAGEVVVR